MPRERSVETQIVEAARRLGVLYRKITGRRGDPDRLFAKAGKVIVIEIKRPGKEPRKNQELRLSNFENAGIAAYSVDNVADGIAILEANFRNTDNVSIAERSTA